MLEENTAGGPFEFRPLSASDVLVQTARFCWDHAGFLACLAGAIVIPGAVTEAVMAIVHPPSADPAAVSAATSFSSVIIFNFLPSLAVGSFTAPLAYGAAGWGATSMCRGAHVTAVESLRKAGSQYGRLFCAELLRSLCFLSGLLCCVLPAVWLSLIWLLFFPVLMNENVRITEAFTRSSRLMTGYMVSAFLASAIAGLGYLAVVSVTQYWASAYAVQALSVLGNGAMFAFTMALSSVIYVSARNREEFQAETPVMPVAGADGLAFKQPPGE